jgi:hypothetical protein
MGVSLINQKGNALTSLGRADHRKLHQKPNVARQGGMENLSHVMSVRRSMTKNYTHITPKTITMTDLIKKEIQMNKAEKKIEKIIKELTDRTEEQIKKEVLYDLWIGDKLFTEEQDEVIETEIQKRLQGEK